jgi:DNA-binding LytR/AlgR family response regulator
MNLTYIIIDDDPQSVLKTKQLASHFQNLTFVASAHTYDDGVNLILQHLPKLVFLEINPLDKNSNLSLQLINELYRYLRDVPKIIVTTNTKEFAFEAMKYEVVDYMLKPLNINDFRKSTLKLTRDLAISNSFVTTSFEKPTVIETIALPAEEKINAVEPIAAEETIVEVVEETIIPDESLEENSIEVVEEENETIVEEPIEAIIEATEEVTTPEETTLLDEKTILGASMIVVKDEIYVVKENGVDTIDITNDLNIEATKNAETIANDSEVHITKSFASDAVVFQKEKPLIICVKSYGDYRYIDSTDILYFEADNNSTDIHLNNGEMVTAFKTLKHFEAVLPNSDFLRIHNSYIININQVSRIHTGNALCYIKDSTTKLPFSKSYKDNVDLIIQRIAGGNYLEI